MRVLVTGGAGYIGSHTTRELLEAGHSVTVLDNLSTGHRAAVDAQAHFIHGDVGDGQLVAHTLKDRRIEAVFHFAACIEVAESVRDPAKYYRNNFTASLVLLGAMKEAGVSKIVFSSTAAVYGNPIGQPILEEAERQPINPYGRSKMMAEMAIEDAAKADGLGYAILRYFNVAGASIDGSIGEAHEPETHLIPRILMDARENRPIGIFGTDYNTPDGSCVRDYVHVVDLVSAHILALDKIVGGQGHVYNIGSEKGFSVREIIDACRSATGLEIRTENLPRRAGDPDILVASGSKIRALGWAPKYQNIQTIISHAWNWHQLHPRGYRA
jgi:UDP-glucose 4-epimerase